MFLSDNAVALSYVRDFISREATAKSVPLVMNADMTWEATKILLQQVYSQLLNLTHLHRANVLALALEEAATDQLAQDATDDWMTAEFQDIVRAAKEKQPFNNIYPVEEYQSIISQTSFLPSRTSSSFIKLFCILRFSAGLVRLPQRIPR